MAFARFARVWADRRFANLGFGLGESLAIGNWGKLIIPRRSGMYEFGWIDKSLANRVNAIDPYEFTVFIIKNGWTYDCTSTHLCI